MFRKSLKKSVGLMLAGLTAVSSLALFTACESNHPKAEIIYEFNGKTYTLEYELYRKLAPSTVRHFIELADAGYYDGLCVHNYTSSAWYTGTYTFSDGKLADKDYFNTVKDFTLTQSVWHDQANNDPAFTVYGEFADNGYVVSSGALSQKFGALTMYYTAKDTEDEVYTSRNDGKGQSRKNYAKNSATSQFFMTVSQSTSSSDKYCTFALLDDDSKEKLNELISAVSDYANEKEDFTTETTVTTDLNDRYVGRDNLTATYYVPATPIVVKTVKITKY